MTITRVAPDTIAASTNLTGAVTAIDEDPDSSGTDWLTATSAVADTACRVTFGAIPTPPGELIPGAAGQEFRLQLRKTTGAPNPTVDVDLYENGSLVANLLSGTSITSTSEQVVAATWNASSLSGLSGANVECRVVGHAAGSPGATPAWNSAGTLSTNATLAGTRNVNIPTHSSGDLLVLHVLCRNGEADGTLTTINTAGWTRVGGGTTMYGSGTARQAIAWKIGDGSETDVNITTTGGATSDRILARVHRFTAANGFAATAVGDVGSATDGTGTSATMPAVTTSANNRLAVAFLSSGANTTMANATGETGGDWTEVTAESAGTNGSFGVQSAAMASAGTITGGTCALGTSGTWTGIGLSLIPATVNVNTVEVGAIEWNADHATQATKTASDTLTVSVSEAAAVDPIEGTTPKSASDSLSVGISEATANLLSILALTDNPTIGITDTVSAILSLLSRTDNPTVGITDAVTAILITLARTDNPTVGVTDVAAILSLLSRTDESTVSITEASNTAVILNSADAPMVGIVESTADVAVSLSRDDPLSISVGSELITILSSLNRTDEPTVGASDAIAQLLNLLSRSDSINVSLLEAAQLLVPISVSDSLVVAVVDSATLNFIGTFEVSTSDVLSTGVTEAAYVVNTLLRSDQLNVLVSDVIASILSHLTRADIPTIAVGENATTLVYLGRADEVRVALFEIASFFKAIGVSDSLDLSINELMQILVALQTRADELGISLTESSNIAALLPQPQRVIFKGSRRTIHFRG